MVPGNPSPRRIVRHISGPKTGPIGDRYVCDDGTVWETVERFSDGTATVGELRGRIVNGYVVDA